MFAFRSPSRAAIFTTLLASAFLSHRALAAVVTVGEVSPIPPSAGGTFNTQLIVGDGTEEETNDIWGTVSINGGTTLQYATVILGDNQGFFGELTVSGGTLGGPISQFNLSSSGSTSNPTVQVGNEGTGYLNVLDGARMTLTNAGGDLSIGLEQTGLGYVNVSNSMLTSPETIVVGQSGIGNLNITNGSLVRTYDTSRSNYVSIGRNVGSIGTAVVDGARSTLSTASTLRVGENGIGTLTIRNGGLVQAVLASTPITPPPFPAMVGIGLNATGSGHIIVDGNQSMLQLRRDLTVGDLGQGTLTIRNGGFVQITDKTVASATVGGLGRLELDGGTFDGSSPLVGFGTTVNGYVGGDGEVRGTFRFNGLSTLEAGPGDHLRFHNDVSNQGSVTINGGEVQFLDGFLNVAAGGGFPTGRVTLENGGTVRFGNTLTNDGVIASAHGVTNIHGIINNPGTLVVARDTVATFHDVVASSGTITILPGGNALFLGDLIFTSAGAGAGGGDFGDESGGGAGGGSGPVLEIGIDPEDPSVASGHLDVSGVANLAGTLALSLEGGFASLVGQTLNLITADSVVGAFDSILLPPVPNGLDVGLVYTPTGLSMQVSSIPDLLPGDFNNDGSVDAADYSVWRDGLGTLYTQADYNDWKANFGQVRAVGSGGLAAAAPEPTTGVLLAGTLAATLAIWRKSRV
jgi:T5SS/PEP-CTERM-associated repeat protein